MPPEPLVAWTEYLVLVVGAVAAIRALFEGGSALAYKAKLLRADARARNIT